MTAGVYVHVPFCLTRCGYCDFNAYAGLDHLASPYVSALLREAELAAPGWSGEEIASVFLGGGTPTTLEVADLKALLARLREGYAVAPNAEVTIEANPDTVDLPKLEGLLEAGFARLSMGAQSFDPRVLASLERLHDPASVRRAMGDARAAGYANVNLDLIYGADGERIESWERTLRETVDLAPEHVSAYALTIEPSTPLGRKVQHGARPRARSRPAGGHVRARVRGARRRRLPALRGLELGEARLRVRPQPRLLGTASVPRARGRRPFVPRRPALVERPPARGVRVARRGRDAAGRRRGTARAVGRLPRGGVPPASGSSKACRRRGSSPKGWRRSWRAVCSSTKTAR